MNHNSSHTYLESLRRLSMPMSVWLLVLWLLGSLSAWGQTFPDKPQGHVTDLAGVLKPDEKRQLEAALRTFADSTSNEIAVAIFPDLQDLAPEEFANAVARKWGIGQKGTNNGILLAVFMKERKVRIEVGYGLEGAVPDVVAKRIIRNDIGPRFKEGKYYEGILAGVSRLASIVIEEIRNPKAKRKAESLPGWVTLLIIGALLAMLVAFMRKNRKKDGPNDGWHDRHGGGGGWGWGGPIFIGGGGGWSGGGGGGGDSWGGFGGGDFGGGGASGDW